MATISSGNITFTIGIGEQWRFVASGEAYVDIGGGSTESYRLIGATNDRLLGGFIVDTPVTIRVITGRVDYNRQYSVEVVEPGNSMTPYWGPITGRSSLPKSQGTWCWQYGERELVINQRQNFVGVVYSFVSGRGERMKAIANGTTNGYGEVYASVEVVGGDGTVYPLYLNGSRLGRCAYGDVMEMRADFGGRYFPAGTRFRVKNRVFQQAHNDSGATNANQFMLYFQYRRGAEWMGRANASLSVNDQAAWAAQVDAPGSSNGTLSGCTFGTIGFVPFGMVGFTTEPTFWVCGDSREHGSADDGSTANVAYGLDAYGVSGQTCRRLGREYGVFNCGFISEQYADIQSVSNLFGRRKLEAYCSHRVFEMGINDFGSGGDFNGVAEDALVATYIASKARVEGLLLTGKKPTWVSTIYPSTTSTDYYITTTNQSVNQGLQLRTLNPAIRGGRVGNDGYFDGASGIQTSIDSQIIKVPSGARSVNTGTGNIAEVAATGGTPLLMTYTHSASIFTPEDHNRNIVIAAAGTGGAALKAQMKYVSGTVVRLVQRGSNGEDFPIVRAQINGGGASYATTASTNILYIQAEQWVTGIHATFEGEDEMAQYDIRQGLVNF